MHDRYTQLISGEKDGIVIPLYAALMSVWVTLFLESLKREQVCLPCNFPPLPLRAVA